jgi:hypothetical protein
MQRESIADSSEGAYFVAELIPIDHLVQRCIEETQKFSNQQSNDPQYCFELMRQALADAHPEALKHIYQIYEDLTLHWVYTHSQFEQTGENADYFAQEALNKFYFAVRGEKFSKFESLARVLSYMKMCVYTTIAQYIRDHQPAFYTSLDAVKDIEYTENFEAKIVSSELWQHIGNLLPDEKDRQLMYWTFVQGYRPAELVVKQPDMWRNEREISVALQRIKRILRRDPAMQNWAES